MAPINGPNADPFRDAIAELLKSSRRADREDHARSEAFASIVRTEAWGYYVQLLEARLQLFSENLLAPAGSIDGLISQEFIKGAMFGLVLARDLPTITMAAMKAQTSLSEEPSDE